MSKLTLTLYRLFLRRANQLEKCATRLDISMPIDKSLWLTNGGGHGWATPAPEYSRDVLVRLMPWLASQGDLSGSFTPASLRQCIRDSFRHPDPKADANELTNRAFDSLKILEEQLHMVTTSSSATSNGVRVDVCSEFVGTQSDLDPTYEAESGAPNKNYFTYRIRISNVGEQTVQLLSRHWLIKNQAGETITEVAAGAKGVVGCTPILKPSTCFAYYSGTDLEGKQGSMEGSYEMAVLDSKGLPRDRFQAEVASFKLIAPEDAEEEG